jgi:hypothetical protein
MNRRTTFKLFFFELLVLVPLCQSAFAQQVIPSPEWNQSRIESAQELIKEGDSFISKTKLLNAKLEHQLLVTKKLKGEAEIFQDRTPMPPLSKLSAQEYQGALKQYNADLAQFALHAKAYQAQVGEFQQLVGECHENEAAYKAMAEKYQLHCQAFHLPDIPPPHICGALNLNQGEALHLANEMRGDFMRVAEAQGALQFAEGRLNQGRYEGVYAANKAVHENQRQEREQQLAAQFGALSQEHELLTIEKQTLDNSRGSGVASLVNAKVSGKVMQSAKSHKD